MSDIRYYTDGEQATASVLNRPLQDLELLAYARTWAEVQKSRENNKVIYPISGQVGGKGSEFELVESSSTATDTLFRTNVYTSTAEGENNNVLFTGGMDEGDTCCINRFGKKTLNIAGEFTTDVFTNLLSARGVSRGGGYYNGEILFPEPSNSYSEKLLRFDLVGIEMWEEKISDRGVVFASGVIQNARGTSTTASQNIPDSYVAFHKGDTDTGKIAKCYVWETLSTSQKQDWIENKNHGIYNKDGELWQTRFRWRTIKDYIKKDTYTIHLGTDTDNKEKLYNVSMYSPYGENIEIQDDYVLTYQGSHDEPTTVPYVGKDSKYTGLRNRNDQGLYVSRNSSACYFLPIIAVQRRNYGAFHPTLNPYGTSAFSKKEGWLAANPSSTAECFDKMGYVTTFEDKLEITGNGRSFLENVVGNYGSDYTGEASFNAINTTRLTSSNFLYSTSHGTFLTGLDYLGHVTWALPEQKILRKIAITNSNDWYTSKRNWMPDDFRIYASNTGDFNGEETELLHVTGGNDSIIKANGIIMEKAHPHVMMIEVANNTAYSFYRFKHESDVQYGMDKIEFFEDTTDITNFALNGIKDLKLVNPTSGKEYYANFSNTGYYVTRERNLRNSFMHDNEDIPLNTDFDIYIDNIDTSRKVKFTDYQKEKVPSGSYYNYDRYTTDVANVRKASYILESDILDLRYILSAKSALKQ